MKRRALLVAAASDGPAPEVLRLLARNHHLVVGIDGGAGFLLGAGVTPDVVIGDLDSLSSTDVAQLRDRGVVFDTHPAHKDETDLDLALAWCRAQDLDSVTLTNIWGGRADHSLAAIGSMSRAADLRPIALSRDHAMTLCTAAERPILDGFEPGDTVSVLVLSEFAVVTMTGVRWPLLNHRLEHLSSQSISNVVMTEDARIHVVEGQILVIAPEEHGHPPKEAAAQQASV